MMACVTSPAPSDPRARPIGVFDSGVGGLTVLLARQVEHALSTRGLQNPRESGEGDYRFLCTGDTEAFKQPGTRFLQMPLGEVEHIDLQNVGALA
jgi:glutamate racemase